jgi:hypothetical protein
MAQAVMPASCAAAIKTSTTSRGEYLQNLIEAST